MHEPARKDYTLDFVLTNESIAIANGTAESPISMNDHYHIEFSVFIIEKTYY